MDMTKLNEMRTLMDLTGQESGILVYYNNDGYCQGVLALNWSSMEDYEVPVLVGDMPISLGWSFGKWTVNDVQDVDDIRDELPGTIDIIKNDDGTLSAQCTMNIMLDYNGDIPALYGLDLKSGTLSQPEPVSGRCYSVYLPGEGDMKVIAPKDWA